MPNIANQGEFDHASSKHQTKQRNLPSNKTGLGKMIGISQQWSDRVNISWEGVLLIQGEIIVVEDDPTLGLLKQDILAEK